MKHCLAVLALLSLATAAFAADPIRPDPKLTPGEVNPAVTQANIDSTICDAGWTKSVRPPASYTNKLKVEQLKARRYEDQNPQDAEEDHFLPIEDGGAPRDPKNLWPMPYAGPYGARVKDVVETKIKRLICGHKITLAEGQKAILTDWIAAYRKYVGPLK